MRTGQLGRLALSSRSSTSTTRSCSSTTHRVDWTRRKSLQTPASQRSGWEANAKFGSGLAARKHQYTSSNHPVCLHDPKNSAGLLGEYPVPLSEEASCSYGKILPIQPPDEVTSRLAGCSVKQQKLCTRKLGSPMTAHHGSCCLQSGSRRQKRIGLGDSKQRGSHQQGAGSGAFSTSIPNHVETLSPPNGPSPPLPRHSLPWSSRQHQQHRAAVGIQ